MAAEQDQRLQEIQREYLDFLDDDVRILLKSICNNPHYDCQHQTLTVTDAGKTNCRIWIWPVKDITDQ